MNSSPYATFLRKYYLSCALYEFIFAYAIYGVLFHMRGLTVFQISLLLAWWAFIAVISEIPSGALADYWSRQKLLIIAPLIKSLCFITWYVADGNFYLYALGFFFWGVGSSLRSGTKEALLYDHLAFFEKRQEYEKVLGKEHFYFHIALSVSLIIGGFIAHYQIGWAILSSVIPLALSAFFASLIKDVPKTGSTEEVYYFDYIKIASQEIRTNTTLFYLLIYGLGLSIFDDLEEFDQLYFELANLPIWAFGLAGFLGSGLNAVSSFYAYRFKNRPWVHYIFPLLAAFLLFLTGVFPGILIIGCLLLSYAITVPLKILIDSQIQHSITSVSRATVTSVNRLLINLFGIAGMPLFGLISTIWNFQTIYLFCSGFLVLLTLWIVLNKRRLKMVHFNI